jgi:hypothetical protein
MMHEKHHGEAVDVTKLNPEWFKEKKVDGEEHAEFALYQPLELELRAAGMNLVLAMKSLSRKLKGKDANCKVCGGLKEELSIDFDGKRYYFTCYRIESLKTKRKHKETDYQKFYEYLKPTYETEKSEIELRERVTKETEKKKLLKGFKEELDNYKRDGYDR